MMVMMVMMGTQGGRLMRLAIERDLLRCSELDGRFEVHL